MKLRGVLGTVSIFLGISAAAMAQGTAVMRTTQLTVTEKTMVGNVLLDPGTYTLHNRDYTSEKVQVGITRTSDKKSMGTVIASRERRNLSPHEATENQTQFTYTTYNGYPAVATWFYPGDEWGERFLYGSNSSDVTMRQTPQAAPAAEAPAPAAPAPAPAAEPAPAAAPAAEPAPAPAPAPMAEAAPPPPAPAPAPEHKAKKQLPKTASSTPLVALLGGLSLAAAAAVRFGRRKAA